MQYLGSAILAIVIFGFIFVAGLFMKSANDKLAGWLGMGFGGIGIIVVVIAMLFALLGDFAIVVIVGLLLIALATYLIRR